MAKFEIQLRIIVVEPPEGVDFALQNGRFALHPPSHTTKNEIGFEFPLTVADAATSPPRLTGKFAQGTPQKRFIYVNSGDSAGQAGSCWRRRAKVPLHTITAAQISQLQQNPNLVLEAKIAGKAKDGGPAAASVHLLEGWMLKGD